MRVIAVDWSGKEARSEEFIWLAEVIDGRIVTLENGRGRRALVDHVADLAADGAPTVAGFDFAFGFPKWWCDEQGWHVASEAWAAMEVSGESLLAACEPPFWGRPGKLRSVPVQRRFRAFERRDTPSAKSVFQIGGAGAVGTGSIRGMPHLRTLTERGFGVWPCGPVRWPLVIEIYPRALTDFANSGQPVNKSRWSARSRFLDQRFASQPPAMLERAAGSEDAFDAAVSALVMAEHSDQLGALGAATDPVAALEGRIWRPEH